VCSTAWAEAAALTAALVAQHQQTEAPEAAVLLGVTLLPISAAAAVVVALLVTVVTVVAEPYLLRWLPDGAFRST
jgi:hypothetical protein